MKLYDENRKILTSVDCPVENSSAVMPIAIRIWLAQNCAAGVAGS